MTTPKPADFPGWTFYVSETSPDTFSLKARSGATRVLVRQSLSAVDVSGFDPNVEWAFGVTKWKAKHGR
jgi:hypothetical protein